MDYAKARYYANLQGRFTSPDPYNIFFEMKRGQDSQEQLEMLHVYIMQPQNWDKYSYSLNNPLKHTDPDGMRPPTQEEEAAVNKLLMMSAQAASENNTALAGGLYAAATEMIATITRLGDGQHDRGLAIAVGAILNIGNPEYANTSTVTITDRNGVGVTIGPANKCNILVAKSHLAAGVNFKDNGRRGGGYPLFDGLPPVANWLGDAKDRKNLSNLAVVTDGTLKTGDIVAWRTIGGASDGHSSIYIGGNVLVYAGGRPNGIPQAQTLNYVDNAMREGHEPRVVRRYNGKP